ncbi:alpha/beta fold hydrolase [Mycobacterium arosiense]|uniref:AB hydrolase-1 domain-containing protein n=1 Tax=Mycobacterium arosiense ATCC BAA-1401 = DSM 45069 TaxID=1265311 RepID=A0A1W9Z5J0_MYCAI|nr:alpha/beta fold hydrolase [Mycobacterium arosiense]ORA07616.1 hypothetical protein BST14_27020 [Mycobacterium arosiense ATCC BAA-1401 = DSM 45069]
MRFVLVHGGMHGAWCWTRLIPELTRLGHSCAAIDLPGHGDRRGEAATLGGYVEAILEVLSPGDVLVGHSMGGIPVTVAAAQSVDKLQHVAYLAAGVPEEGKSIAELSELVGGLGQFVEVKDDQSIAISSFDHATELFYHDCDPSTARWAFERLAPQSLAPMTAPVTASGFWTSDIPRSYILCELDRMMTPRAAEHFAERLGVMPLSLQASHSPFLSLPEETARLLIDAVMTQPVHPPAPGEM